MKMKSKTYQKFAAYYLGGLISLAVSFYAVFILRTRFLVQGETYFTLVDDAMISMRYAKHLSRGFGLVWNIGQHPIEGFTNLGWTLYMSFLHLFPVPLSKISLLVMVTSVFLLLGIAFVSYKIVRCIKPDAVEAALIVSTIVLFYYPLVFWSLRGMEVGLVTFLVYLSICLVLSASQSFTWQRSVLIGLVMFLAILGRYDAALQMTVLVAYLFVMLYQSKRDILMGIPAFFFYLVGVVGILAFQYAYFASILPNTYYLKVAGVSVAERIFIGKQVFVEYALRDFWGLLFFSVVGLVIYRKNWRKEIALLFLFFSIQSAYSIYVGGDYAEPLFPPQVDAANRFITQGMPALFIVFGIVLDEFITTFRATKFASAQDIRSSLLLVLGISMGVIVLISGEPWYNWRLYNAPLWRSDVIRTKLGLHIRDNTTDDAVIATHVAGQIPYYSERQTIDLLGKSDPIVAKGPPATRFRPGHNKWNYTYSIMELKPDLIAEEWGTLRDFLKSQTEYYRLDNGIWVRKNSTKINVDGLSQPYR